MTEIILCHQGDCVKWWNVVYEGKVIGTVCGLSEKAFSAYSKEIKIPGSPFKTQKNAVEEILKIHKGSGEVEQVR